jgi:predicted outer membrane repeat protein
MKIRILLLIMLALLLIMPAQVFAAGTVGTGTPESCTESALRSAVEGGGTVTFNCGGAATITLTKQIVIKTDTTIDGGGNITISGGGTTRLFENQSNFTIKNITLRDAYQEGDMGGGAIQSVWRKNVTVENVKFINNQARLVPVNFDNGGGAIRVHSGVLTIRNSEFTGNRTHNSSGGAIHSMLSNVEITDSVFTDNHSTAPGYSGAFYNDGTYEGGTNGYITFKRNRFINNSGEGQGGGVFIFLYPDQVGSKATIEESQFIGNEVKEGSNGDALGGALRVGNGPVSIKNVLFHDNHADQQGGALWTGEVANLNITNVTMSGNSAELGGGLMIASSGGGTITNATIAYNTASGHGGGIYGGSGITLRNTIVAHNTAGNPWNINHNCGTTYSNGGGNVQYPARISDGNDHNCVDGAKMQDPILLPLGDNGGGMQTHALSAESPAVNAGTNTECPKIDQRGVARPQGDKCDSGAFELEGGAPGLFTLISPTDSASLNELLPTFRWNPSSGAAEYKVTVKDANGVKVFSTKVSAAICSAECSTVATSALIDGGTYTLKVKAANTFGKKTAKAAFKVDHPGAPTNLSPAAGSTVDTFTPLLSWNGVSAATEYQVKLKHDQTGAVTKLGGYASSTICAGETCTVDLSTLPNDGGTQSLINGTYKWFVLAKNADGKSKSTKVTLTVQAP